MPSVYTNYGDPFETYPIDTGRLRRVVELVAEQAEWGRQLPPGHGQGIAAHRWFLSYVATVVEVAVDDKGKLTVPRVDTAIDCGFAANPERIRSQIEGAAVMGLSIAKYGEISFKNGRAQQNNFDGFQVARIDESPAITHVHIIPAAIDGAVERGRRARIAALFAGAVQRDLRRDRQAHPAAADRRSAGELKKRWAGRRPPGAVAGRPIVKGFRLAGGRKRSWGDDAIARARCAASAGVRRWGSGLGFLAAPRLGIGPGRSQTRAAARRRCAGQSRRRDPAR